jgi:surfeit locus 1 family protein
VEFAAESGLALLPVTLQQTGAASEGVLREWPAVNLGVDKHYGYAFQWFGLSALIAGLYLWFQIIRRFIFHPKDPSNHV